MRRISCSTHKWRSYTQSKMRKLIIIAVITYSLSSCIPHKKLVNYRQSGLGDTTSVAYIKPPKLKIQPNDVLSITVYGDNKETIAPYNASSNNFENNKAEAFQLSGYLVDAQGYIDFPVLGRIRLGGLNTTEAREKMERLLEQDNINPIVNLRLINFKVTITGEVRFPGTFTVLNERITLTDAIAMAGGLTDYANRLNILVTREEEGRLTFKRINIQEPSYFSPDYYYLKQNDMIYVEPIKEKTGAVADRSSKFVQILTAFGTVITLGIALFR